MISVIGATLKKLRDDAHDASLSPDGSQIAFRDAITQDIWLMSADGGQARLLIKREPGDHLFEPSWFRNGKRVVYGKYRVANGEATQVLESRDLQGGASNLLLSNTRLTNFAWGQNGRLIYSVREVPPNHADSNLWELRYDTTRKRVVRRELRVVSQTGLGFSLANRNSLLTAAVWSS